MESSPNKKFGNWLRGTAARIRSAVRVAATALPEQKALSPRRVVDGKEVGLATGNRKQRRAYLSRKHHGFRKVRKVGEYVHLSPPQFRNALVGKDGSVQARLGFYATRRGEYLHATKGMRDRVIERKWVWA